jgi:hypothetical protein
MNNFDVKNSSTELLKNCRTVMAGIMLICLAGCESDPKDGMAGNTLELPTELTLNLQCPDVGINTETCILDDEENPFARSVINDTTKFELSEDIPSAKSSFYLWGTALANSQQGENQFYTAQALHELYTQGGSVIAREQAKRAYRAVLDHFFDSFTFFKVELASGDVFISLVLSDLVGERIYNPFDDNLAQLYDSELEALAALGSWGYSYDITNGSVSRNR